MTWRKAGPVTAWRVLAAVLAAWLIMTAAVQAGLSTTDWELLSTAHADGGLDYTRVPGTVAPLTEAFITQALGLPPAALAAVADAEPAPARASDGGATSSPTARPGPTGDRLTVTHPPDNDDFEQAYEVSHVPFAASTNAANATRQPGEPASCSPVGGTLWYRWTASETRPAQADTAGSTGATTLAVFRGTELSDLDEVGCHTDLAGHARVPFTAEAGQTYLFQVTQPAGGGVVAFNLELLGLVTEVVPHGSLTPRAVMTQRGPRLSGWLGPGTIDVSADGQVVAFNSIEDDLVEGDTNAAEDLFVRDLRTGAVERVSVATDGTEQQPPLLRPHALIDEVPGVVLGAFDLSGDGQVVGFWSEADNLVPGDTNAWPDLFVHDRRTGVTERVSVWSDGRQGFPTNDPHEDAWFYRGGRLGFQSVSLSHDGRYVVFSTMLRLHADDQPRPPTSHDLSGCVDDRCGWEDDVYLHDRLTGETTLVGRASDGRAARDETWHASISGNGRYVSFVSQDDSLTPGDDNLVEDVYVRDLVTGHTERVSVSSAGAAANANSSRSALSYDGRHVVFSSYASNLVPGDTNEFPDIFVHDRVTGETERVSVSTTGEQAEGGRPLCDILRVSISYDGRYVVFSSPSNNLVPDDNRVDLTTGLQAMSDVFLRDRVRGTTTMVSITPSGHQPNAPSMGAAISGDARSIAFVSWADLEDDTATPAPPLNLTEVDLRRGAYVYRPPTVVR